METAKEFTRSLKFVVWFLVGVLFLSFFGNTFLMWYLILVLLGMLIVNADTVSQFITQMGR